MAAKPRALPDRTGLVTATIKKSGGSLIITVPAGARDALHLAEGQEMTVAVEDGRLVYEAKSEAKRRSKYTLEELLAQCDLDGVISDEERAWLDAPPVGRELW